MPYDPSDAKSRRGYGLVALSIAVHTMSGSSCMQGQRSRSIFWVRMNGAKTVTVFLHFCGYCSVFQCRRTMSCEMKAGTDVVSGET
jgi:hypothetical protein